MNLCYNVKHILTFNWRLITMVTFWPNVFEYSTFYEKQVYFLYINNLAESCGDNEIKDNILRYFFYNEILFLMWNLRENSDIKHSLQRTLKTRFYLSCKHPFKLNCSKQIITCTRIGCWPETNVKSQRSTMHPKFIRTFNIMITIWSPWSDSQSPFSHLPS